MSTTAAFCLRGKPVDMTDFIGTTTAKLVHGTSAQFKAALDDLSAVSIDQINSIALTYAIGRAVHTVIENHQPNRAALLIEWVRHSNDDKHMPLLIDQMGEVLASCLHPATHITAAEELSAAFARGDIDVKNYPRLDAAVAKRLPHQLPSHHQLDLLGERLPLLLAIDLPKTRIASTNLLCGWLMAHQAKPLDKTSASLLSNSVNAHFDALSAPQLSATVLRNRVTDYLLSQQNTPPKPLNQLFTALASTGTSSTAYWAGLKPYEKTRILTAVNTNPTPEATPKPQLSWKTRALRLIGLG